ncbi:hypothetical protein SELMODRAFT_409961 [Selaginella moellendorffii]|uniref:HMA domain-containing protein n=1 Tax=Selaginella moellendorffii TaxID=88036 RepID=D8RD11_SELML|nr:hypothetical protein SELMODRAFT_409961 [Selaginella moellendorffii]
MQCKRYHVSKPDLLPHELNDKLGHEQDKYLKVGTRDRLQACMRIAAKLLQVVDLLNSCSVRSSACVKGFDLVSVSSTLRCGNCLVPYKDKFHDAFSGGTKMSQMVSLRVNLDCSACRRRMHKLLSTMRGVEMVEIDVPEHRVIVRGEVTENEVLRAARKLKNNVTTWEPPVEQEEKLKRPLVDRHLTGPSQVLRFTRC